MARLYNRLTAKAAAAIAAPGRYADGDGLYLDVAAGGLKSWVFFYRSPVQRIVRKGKVADTMSEMGFGPFVKDDKDDRSNWWPPGYLRLGIAPVVEPKPANDIADYTVFPVARAGNV